MAVFLNGGWNCKEKPRFLSLDVREKNELGKEPPGPLLRIALGGMITPRKGFAFYRKFLDYLSAELEIPVEYIDKEDYATINSMLKQREVDVAFVCGGPYVDGKKDFGLKLLVAPKAYGGTVYYSYILAGKNSKYRTFKDLRGRKFAFTDPLSNTGKLVPEYMLSRMNETPDSFFREYIFTYAHDKSIKAVARGLVDGAAVDSLIWEYENKKNPEFTSRTRIIQKSPPFGIPPVVVRPGLDEKLTKRMKRVFLEAHKNARGRRILQGMMIEKFVPIDDAAYDSIRMMKRSLLSFRKR